MPTVYGREILINNIQSSSMHEKKGIEGELQILNYLEQMMPIDATIIAKPEIGNLEPDFIVILPKEGFFIVEVKNFSLGAIDEVLSNGAFKFKNGSVANPFSQVGAHLEQLNQFIMSNYRQDVYRNIGKLVVFPGFTQLEFNHRFCDSLSKWTYEQFDKFYRYHLFSDDLTDNLLKKIGEARKFPGALMKLSRGCLIEIAEMIKPRPNNESSLNILHKEKLIDEFFFENVFTRLVKKDAVNGQKIQNSIKDLLNKELPYFKGARTYEQAYLALRNLMGAIKAESSTYLNSINELTKIKNKMLNKRTRIVEEFKEDVQRGLHSFFEKQLKIMQDEVRDNTKWHTSLSDTSKKAAAFVYNPLLKIAKKTNRLQDKVDNLTELDDKSELEKILEEYLKPTKVGEGYDSVMKTAIKRYEENWIKTIEQYTPNLRGLKTFLPASLKSENQQLKHKLGASEQVLGLTIGSAVIGTISLAAGWHTLTYAALNVFPPIAVFAAIATIATAVLRKDNEIQKKQSQLEEAVNSYRQHIFQQIDPPRLSGNHKSLFQQIEKTSDDIVNTTICEWEKQLFGQIKVDDYQELINSMLLYAELIDESISDINNRME